MNRLLVSKLERLIRESSRLAARFWDVASKPADPATTGHIHLPEQV